MPTLNADKEKTAARALRRARATLLLCCGLALAGCNSAPLASYDLDPAPVPAMNARAIRGALVIPEPRADDPYDTDRIIVRSEPNQLSLLSDAQWSDRLTSMVQSRLIATFQNAHFLKSVGRPGDPGDYELIIDIRRFEIDATSDLARVELAARIIGGKSGKGVAGKIFNSTAPAPTTANGAAAAALDKALADAMRAIVGWTAKQI
ncbi:MAG: ABC-type transport auxiliary lipoprotein family protein [Beijerinckiaceae bacterium]